VIEKAFLSACVVTGALMAFFGYRMFKGVLGLFGALAGGYVAALAGAHLSGGNEAVALLCGVMGAALGGVLMVAAYLLGVFVAGATLGGMLAAVLTVAAVPDVRLVVIAGAAVIGGFLALFVQRVVIIIATALNGAALALGGIWLLVIRMTPRGAWDTYLSGRPVGDPGLHTYLILGAWAVLGCLGMWAQFAAPEPVEKEAGDADESQAR
jgi:hypothetical protein